ncbi:hypothetical protein [Pseudomonas sp. UBA2522]|uniref:hypothetical protein n=1 Tax=Pseudomonas sp. UBA2522 TaxID=1947309 RepID=UPI00257AE0B2|nr:hypothetical protein [Pseudomonas sp. UBA2522]
MTSEVFVFGSEEILDSLRPYQKALVSELLANHDEVTAAKIWLSSTGPLDLRRFGGAQDSGGEAFYTRFQAEFRAFICGGEKYKGERESLVNIAKPAANYVVTAISAAIAVKLGIASGLIFPAVALLLKVVGKLGLNAWCEVAA